MSQMQVPPVTLEDLYAFQAKHFPHALNAISPRTQPRTQPQPQPQPQSITNATYITTNPPYEVSTEDAEADEEDLGYYPDGTKRTLTDEQIRIFRHSEIHALLRERQLAKEEEEFQAKYGKTNDDDGHGDEKGGEVGEKIEAGEQVEHEQVRLDAKTPVASRTGTGTGTKRSADEAGSNEPAAKRRANSKSKSKTKSDTQEDVQLDYNEEQSVSHSNTRRQRPASQFAGRKIISYDD
ncbi:hypothetical protein BDW69DRAFT_148189 [Aspergillus filifer]